MVDQETYEDSTENFIVATVDAALVAQNAAIAAESLGLGIVYIGGVRNSIAEFSETLELPELVYPVFGMCLGYPDQEPGLRPRLPVEAVLHHDSYNRATIEEVKNYDRTSSEYLSLRTHGKNNTPWSALMAKRLAEPVRSHEGLPEGEGVHGALDMNRSGVQRSRGTSLRTCRSRSSC